MFHQFILFLAAVGAFVICGCTNNHKGASNNPIEVYILPSKYSHLNARVEFKKWMENETGYKFNLSVPQSSNEVLEAFDSKRADIAFLTVRGLALAYKKSQVEVQFISVGTDGKTERKGQFIVKSNSKISKLEDLSQKTIAYTAPTSVTGYLLPAYLLKQKKIQVSKMVFAGTHGDVVTMVYQGQADAGATFYEPPVDGEEYDARQTVITQFPDVMLKIKILDFTRPLANDAVVFRKDLDESLKEKLRTALKKWSTTESGKKTLKELNKSSGLKNASIADFLEDIKLLHEIEDDLN